LKREEQLLSVTREQVRDVAQRWLSQKNLGLVLVGFPKKAVFARVEALVDRFA
jgi:predicted Zn-dependent peptidase